MSRLTGDLSGVTYVLNSDTLGGATAVHAMTIRVADCEAAYDALRARGARFLAPPVASEWEVRAFFRDPDGHLFEISEARTGSTTG